MSRVLRHSLSSFVAKRAIGIFLNSFDVVAFIQIENFLELQGAVDAKRVVVHAMSNRFQYSYDPYDELKRGASYRFVTWNRAQSEDLSSVRGAEIFEWPLSMNFDGYASLPVDHGGKTARIGVFTRLSREKPLEPLLLCFRELTEHIDATLHVYGRGNPSMFASTLTRLGLGGRVTFEGHQHDMIATVRRDRLSMCWLMSLGSFLGYSSIELAATGMPMLFWNYGTTDTANIAAESAGAVRAFNSVRAFVDVARRCLTDQAALRKLGLSLQQFVRERHDIRKNIGVIQDYYRRLPRE